MPSGRITLSAYVRLLRGNANLRRLWLAQIVSELGDWLYTVAIYAQLLRLTHGSAKSIGLAFVLQVLPQMLVSPLAGVINDRLSRRRVMIFADWARAVIVAAMLLAQARGLLWLIYVLLFLETVFWGLFEPARNATIPNVAEGEDVLVANALASTTWSFNFAVGFTAGGVLAALAGKEAVFILNSLSFAVSALLIARMRFEEPHIKQAPALRLRDLADFSPVMEGIRYLLHDPRLTAMLLVKFGLGFMGANWVLVTVLGDRQYPVAPTGIDPHEAGMIGMSLLMGFRGLGALIGPILSARLAGNDESRMRRGILMGFLAAAAGYIVFGQASTLFLAGLTLLVAHAGGSTIWVFSSTLLQLNSEDRYRGRVFSAEFALMTLSMSASSWLAGMVIDLGMPAGAVASWVGAAMLLPGGAWLWAQRLWRPQAELGNARGR